jgi:hypothetical protein
MKKSQSLIVQFVLFFLIGFSLFLAIGSLFRFRSDVIKNDVTSLELKLINSYVSSAVINSVDACKQCDEVTVELPIKNIAGYSPVINLKNGLNVSTVNKYYFSSIHNLNETLNIQDSKVYGAVPITLMYEKIKNNLVVK